MHFRSTRASAPSRDFPDQICALAPVDDDVGKSADGIDGVKDTKLHRLQSASDDSAKKDPENRRSDLTYSKVRNIANQEPGGIRSHGRLRVWQNLAWWRQTIYRDSLAHPRHIGPAAWHVAPPPNGNSASRMHGKYQIATLRYRWPPNVARAVGTVNMMRW